MQSPCLLTIMIFHLFTTTAPSSPQNLTLQVASNTTILVSWLPPEDENGIIIEYRIHVKEQGVNSSERVVNVSGGATSKLVNLLKPYTNYTFRMRARTSAGYGNFGVTETARTYEGRMYTSFLYHTINFVLFVLIIQGKKF